MQTISKRTKFTVLFLCLIMVFSLITACGEDEQPEENLVKSITLNMTEYTFTSYDTKVKLEAYAIPSDATNASDLVWASANVNVASINAEHEVVPMSNGKTVITVTTSDGTVTAMCNITVDVEEVVEIPVIPVESVRINTESYTFEEIGDTYRLTEDVLPFSATDPTVVWSSSDETVATVDAAGLVTAVKKGTATITVTTNDGGFTASCEIKVEPKETTTTQTPSTSGNTGSSGNTSTSGNSNSSGNTGSTTTTKFDREKYFAPVIDSDGFLVSDGLEYFNSYNSDCVAWLYIPNTKGSDGLGEINFAAAQGNDNDTYLSVGLDKKWKDEGSVVLDWRNSIKTSGGSITDKNTIFYGHAKGKTTFDRLEFATRSDSWFNNESNRYVYLNTLKEETVWKVFACYYTDSSQHYYLDINWLWDADTLSAKQAALTTEEKLELILDEKKMMNFINDGETFAEFANNWRQRISAPENDKEYETTYKPYAPILRNRDYGVTVGPDDQILTLSTCSSDVGNMRYVLHAVLVKSRPRTDRD